MRIASKGSTSQQPWMLYVNKEADKRGQAGSNSIRKRRDKS